MTKLLTVNYSVITNNYSFVFVTKQSNICYTNTNTVSLLANNSIRIPNTTNITVIYCYKRIKDERLVISIGHNRDLDRLLRLRSIPISEIDFLV